MPPGVDPVKSSAMQMLIGLLTLALLASDASGSSTTSGQVLEPAFGGTIVSTYPDGRVSKLWLNRDGSFSAEGRKHERQAGRWVIRDHDVCLSQLKPFPIPFAKYCSPIPTTGVTEAWAGKAVTGEPIVNRLSPAR